MTILPIIGLICALFIFNKKFILTDEINRLMKDNAELRFICKHEFVNGACKFCDTPEESK